MIFDRSDNSGNNRALLVFVLGTLIVGSSATLFTEPNIPTWYAALQKPSIAPPNWVFAPVWTTLYILMGVAAARVWKLTGLRAPEMLAYGVQLFLNFCWSAIFFALHAIGAALAEILLLDAAILVTIILFWRRDRIAGLLLLPYLAWTLFATVLTYAFWQLNTGA